MAGGEPDEATLRKQAQEIASRNPLICGPCGGPLLQPKDCPHHKNGAHPCCIPSTENLADDIYQALAAIGSGTQGRDAVCAHGIALDQVCVPCLDRCGSNRRALASPEKVTVPPISQSMKLVLEQIAVLVEKGAISLSEIPKWLRSLAEGPKSL